MGTASDLFYGLSTALGYGTGDFLARGATHRVGHLAVLLYMQIPSLAVLLPLAAILEGSNWHWSLAWPLLLGLGVVNLVGSLFLYRAFEYGVLSVVSPLISSYPAVTAALAVAFLGDRPEPVAIMGIVSALAGIILISRARPRPGGAVARDPRKGLSSALVSFAAYGVFYFALKYVVADVGPVTSAAVARLVALAVLAVALAAGFGRTARPPRDMWPTFVAIGLIDGLGFIAYTVGITTGSVAIIGTLSGLFSAVTVGLAAVFLRERLARIQYGGMAAIFLGVVLMALR